MCACTCVVTQHMTSTQRTTSTISVKNIICNISRKIKDFTKKPKYNIKDSPPSREPDKGPSDRYVYSTLPDSNNDEQTLINYESTKPATEPTTSLMPDTTVATQKATTQTFFKATPNLSKNALKRIKKDNFTLDKLNDKEESRALDIIFTLQSLTDKSFGMKAAHLKMMQLHCKKLSNIYAATLRGEHSDFEIKGGILYQIASNEYKGNKEHTYLKLCVSPILAEMIAESVHNNQNIHHTAESLYQILSRLVYSPNLSSTTTKIVSRCPVCILGSPKLVRRIMGSHRYSGTALPN